MHSVFPTTFGLGTPTTVISCQLPRPSHAFVDHLAEVQGLVCKLRPTSVQDNFKDGPHQPACRLGKDKAMPVTSPLSPDLMESLHTWLNSLTHATSLSSSVTKAPVITVLLYVEGACWTQASRKGSPSTRAL